MKKIILLLAFFTTIASKAQNFPADHIELLEGKELKVMPLPESSQPYGYRNFYSDSKLKKVYKEKKHSTPYNVLVGKVFKVLSYEPYLNLIGQQRYKLKLENEDTGILYYEYDPSFEYDFNFEVIGGLVFSEEFYCEQIMEKSTSTIEQYLETPMKDGVQLTKLFSGIAQKPFAYLIRFNLANETETKKDVIYRV